MSAKSANGAARRYVSLTDSHSSVEVTLTTRSYGTYDHLMLLLGRLADFASRDLSRKRAVFKANPGRGASPGMFPGMVPRHPEKFVYPRGFTPPRDDEAPLPQSQQQPDVLPESTDLDATTAAALREWEGILRAFETLRDHFGPQFEPMGIDVHPARPTPFGLAAHYRTYSIAGIWMNYYMGLIVLHRAHPTMPPIAMVAAGLSAQTTAGYCLEVGRIAAGLEENIACLTSVTTLMASALIECCFPLFVAGIQVCQFVTSELCFPDSSVPFYLHTYMILFVY